MLMVTDEDLVLYAPKNTIPPEWRSVGFLTHEMKTLWVVVQKEVKNFEDNQQALEAMSPNDERFQEFSDKEAHLEDRAEMYEGQFLVCLNQEKFDLPKRSDDVKSISLAESRYLLDIGPAYEVFVAPT